MTGQTLITILYVAPPLLIAVILHEIAHGIAAGWLGDPTARSRGRITLNPLRHIDPFMTIILPLLLVLSGSPIIFGGAKPVPINPGYFRNPRRGMLWTAAAGPATNLILAVVSYLGLRLYTVLLEPLPLHGSAAWLLFLITLPYVWFTYGVVINVVLAVFNLIPIPPLDGGRIAVGLLPLAAARRWAQLERYGLLIVVALLYFKVLDGVFRPVLTLLRDLLQLP